MNAEFEELYQQVILDHSKRPRNFGPIDGEAIHVDGDNPSCGDEIHLHVRFDSTGGVEEVKFTGLGCAISQASASLMTLKMKGKSGLEAREMLAAFQDLVTEGKLDPPKMLGDLRLLAGVRKFPQRVKCAMLAWRALEQALHCHQENKGGASTISTEESAPHCP